MQDTYRNLLDLQNEVDWVKKIDKDCKKLSKTTQEHEEKLKEIDWSSGEFQDNTERNFKTLSKGLDDESSTRELEHKRIKNVLTEFEKTLRSQGYNFEYKVQAAEASIREEVLRTGSELDWK